MNKLEIVNNCLIVPLDKCFECGEPMGEMHHVIPKTRGGKNVIPLCVECHCKVHNMKNRPDHAKLTKEGIQKAKSNGVKIGKPENFKDEHRIKGAQAMKEKAMLNPNSIKALEIILDLRKKGGSFCSIAKKLNDMEYKTPKGCNFTDTAVYRIYKRHI